MAIISCLDTADISKPALEACFSGGVGFDALDKIEYADWTQDIGSIGGIIVMPAFMKCVLIYNHERWNNH
jgi:hypothetical protein